MLMVCLPLQSRLNIQEIAMPAAAPVAAAPAAAAQEEAAVRTDVLVLLGWNNASNVVLGKTNGENNLQCQA